jgi:hypothetical protein
MYFCVFATSEPVELPDFPCIHPDPTLPIESPLGNQASIHARILGIVAFIHID